MKVRVAMFDDSSSIRNSIALLLGTDPLFELVGVFENAQNCVEDVLQCQPDVVLMDIEMPGVNGIEAVKSLKKEVPAVQILMQTVFEDEERIYESIIAGASGYVIKGQINTTLIDSIKDVLAGGAPMSPGIARKVFRVLQQNASKTEDKVVDYKLTPREKEIIACLVNGQSYKMIAGDLNISYETVRSHMKHIYEKLGVGSLTETVALAINQRIV
ncbi:response regulator transcription factor [Chitinophaga agrisoli]|uniref:Response regulator transcription factor n=1 Tax=Chitinophaga agrisoli TaxID=2607653 RepID=A0A5B2VY07_9BACT|nr:response regulator transcription factor [Chitinophaga agrisoli]KAA2243430.1 response regulator transcription factor [Chitinophaga agrisoli]